VTVAILVPVLGRPHRVAPLMQAFRRTTPHPYRLLFIADPDDQPEIDAIRRARADYIVRAGSYARKINEAARATSEPLLFLAADDLAPQPDWLESATRRLRGPVRVVGVNDLITRRRREHATHFLMTRDYATQPTLDGSRGTESGYSYHGCRCDECRAAWARSKREWRARRRGSPTTSYEGPNPALSRLLDELFPDGLTDECPARRRVAA
jgi:hypothetical protein